MNKFVLFTLAFFSISTSFSQEYKNMMQDESVNFYDVVAAAETYFSTHDKNVKGSGWKPYQRWKNNNEYKYFPSGDRTHVDPYYTKNVYRDFIKKNKTYLKKIKSFNGWVELGPSEITTITENHAPGLGRIEDFYVDPNNSNLVYAVSKSGGFWKSTDGGKSWTGGSTDALISAGVDIIAVSPTNENTILINVRNPDNGFSHGIYRSTDGGSTWALTNFSQNTVAGSDIIFRIYTIAYHPTTPNTIFIGTNKGFFKSTDNLTTWTAINYRYDITKIAFHPTDEKIMYIFDKDVIGANRNYVLRSTDGGDTFSRSSEIVGNSNDRLSFIAVTPDCPDCVYFASNHGIWKSTDKGIHFTHISNPTEDVNGLAVNTDDKTKMIYGYVDIFASSNEGVSFNKVTRWSLSNTNGTLTTIQTSFETSTNYVHADMRKIKCINGVFYVGTDGFLSKSTDNGTNWEIIGQGIATRENYKVAVSQSNTDRSISGSQDNGVSIKKEDGWIEFAGGDGMDGVIHPLNDDWMIGSKQNGLRVRTLDGGLSQASATPAGAESGSWEAPIIIDPNNQMAVYDFREKVYKSTDFGINYQSVGQPTFHPFAIQQAAIAENNSNIMVVTYNEKIEKSTNGGQTFTSIRNNLPNANIMDVAFDPNDDNTIIVVYAQYTDGNKVYKTTNGGTSWVDITGNLGGLPVHSVVIDHSAGANIYIGTELGLYTKTMAATNWSLYNTNLPNTTIQDLKIVYGSNTLKAATWGRGLWETSLIGRNNFPRILTTRITNQPTDKLPKFGTDQIVTSGIEYAGTLTDVHVAWSVGTPTFNNTIPMSNTGGNIWVANTAIPEQPVDSKLYFKVVATGSNNDTSETYKYMYTIKPFEYCTAESRYTDEEHITNVTFNTINNTTGASQYSDYTNISTDVTRGNTYDFSVSYTKDYNTDQVKFWIDFNHDADFDDPGEGFTFTAAPGTEGPYTLNIAIPNDAKLGATRLRVRLTDTGIGSNKTPCGTSEYGEVEEYIVNIIDNTDVLVTSISVSGQGGVSTIATQGSTLQMIAEVLPANATDTSVIWSVSDGTGSASIDANGLLTAIDDGTVTVTATANDASGVSSSTVITISNQTLSVNSYDLKNISIFPNPAHRLFAIRNTSSISITEIRIFDLLGREVKKAHLKNKIINIVDISNLDKGIYLIYISENDKRIGQKRLIID